MLTEQQEDGKRQLREIVEASNRVVFFGGAGVSTESGIPDFRSATGIYHQKYRYSPEQVVSHSFFMEHTEAFYDFYKSRMVFPNAKPNAAHLKLAELEQAGHVQAVVTQNIDGLHQAAGSKNVLELHGSVLRNHCMDCGRFYDVDAVVEAPGVPRCTECGGIIKPDVVLYKEQLDEGVMVDAARAISEADVLIVAGTSLAVYPAASFLGYFNGNHLIEVNLMPTPLDKSADLLINAKVGEVFDW